LGLTVKRLRRAVRNVPQLAGKAVAEAVRASTHPRSSAEYAASLKRVVEPPPASSSKLMQGGSRTKWRFETLECEMGELKQAGRSGGGWLNDAFASATLGGIRRYHDQLGAEMGDIPISMPVAMRTGEEAKAGGNKFAGAFFTAPAGETDPANRITQMRAQVDR